MRGGGDGGAPSRPLAGSFAMRADALAAAADADSDLINIKLITFLE